MLPAFVSLLGLVTMAAFGWVFMLGNRVTRLETKYEDLPTLITTQFAAVHQRLDRIEKKLWNGDVA